GDTHGPDHIGIVDAGFYDLAEGRLIQQQPGSRYGSNRHEQHAYAIDGVEKIAHDDLAVRELGNGEREWGSAEYHAQRLLYHHGKGKGEQQAERRIGPVESAKEKTLHDHAQHADSNRRDHKGQPIAQAVAKKNNKIGAYGIESAMSQIDNTAQAENDGKAQSDQQIVEAQQQAIGHLLNDENQFRRQNTIPGIGAAREGSRARRSSNQANLHIFSSWVGASASRFSPAPGTGLLVTMKS